MLTSLAKYAEIGSIRPNTKYPLNEIVDLKLIPGVDSYTTIYNLVTTKRVQVNNEKKYKNRKLITVTTPKSIKAIHAGSPWGKIRGKILVEGKEIIIFRKLNNLL